jgi:DNA-binding XRE family transcriptional regulator
MEESTFKSIGKKLKILRKIKYPNDTQRDFATRIRASAKTYTRMELGDGNVAFKYYVNAAKLLDINEKLINAFESDSFEEESASTQFARIFLEISNRNLDVK